MTLLYLAALLVALFGMVMLDRRFTLFFWRDARRAGVVLAVGVLFFFAWDLAGVGGGIFFRGETSFMTGLQVAPEIPLEEIFFLALLCYLTMNVYGALTSRQHNPGAAP
ncbi:lycopene cyclase domain-containing protein [Salinibacterium sp. G-O1]|uniref:lycopene cyclase domain-containing protein n=1 Tax=Salinibacterium sp. G-O1 TaxID=3046208 RepID=UPI0024B9A9DA|nr:lycopene cyclase domain-containing protein [Salinibacterium sp. G-O1]MDJ0333746.1 lycopene cyclase domain-containing protein [Salinibacterium sp. G-O1]